MYLKGRRLTRIYRYYVRIPTYDRLSDKFIAVSMHQDMKAYDGRGGIFLLVIDPYISRISVTSLKLWIPFPAVGLSCSLQPLKPITYLSFVTILALLLLSVYVLPRSWRFWYVVNSGWLLCVGLCIIMFVLMLIMREHSLALPLYAVTSYSLGIGTLQSH
jgi:hypothetical protein